MIDVENICKKAKHGSYVLGRESKERRNAMLAAIADAIEKSADIVLAANKIDVEALKGRDSVFLDRLTLTPKRIDSMCDGLRQLINLEDPIGEVVEKTIVRSGLEISKVRSPLGVIAVVYEARPNVTADVAGLCIKTANAVVLRGGSDAINSNRAIYNIMINALNANGFDSEFMQFIDDTDRASANELFKQSKYVDVLIPRGGNKLKETVLANATMPVIASAGGNCHIYVHESADIGIAVDIILNAKVQRPTVCNAVEQLVIDKTAAPHALPVIYKALREAGVEVRGDKYAQNIIGEIPLADEKEYYEEHLSLTITVKCVDDIGEAIDWINEHNTMHSDAIIAENKDAQEKFMRDVDSGCIYINASTRFTDGYEFGFGAEIGISTQKLHARGPLGLKQLTSEKYVAVGKGTIRK